MSDEPKKPPMRKEDLAFFLKNIWESLLAPDWLRNDLIDLGKAVFAKVPLAKLDEDTFNRLFPSLVTISESLATRIHDHVVEEFEKVQAAYLAAHPPQTTPVVVKTPPAPIVVKAPPTPTPPPASAPPKTAPAPTVEPVIETAPPKVTPASPPTPAPTSPPEESNG